MSKTFSWLFKISSSLASLLLIISYTLMIIAGSTANPVWNSWMKDIVKENNGEYLVQAKKYKADGYCKETNTIYEFHGDYWHGNQSISKYKILTEKQLKQKEMDDLRTKELIEKGFNVIRIWENEIQKMSLEDFKEKINFNIPIISEV